MTDIFSIKDFKLPEGFIWGSSTAGHQIEGNNIHSDHWHDEQERLKQNPEAEVSGEACNHYNMVEEDVELLCTLGHGAYRMGIEWARIEPQENRFDEEAVAHYVNELNLLKQKGIKTFVTLVHFTVPMWFREKNAFQTLDNLKYFERYLNYIVPKICDYVDFWNVINEFNLGLSNEDLVRKYNSVMYHSLGYHTIKKYSKAPVSSAHALVQYYGKRQNDVFDTTLQKYRDICDNEFFFHAMRTGELVVPTMKGIINKDIKNTCDFWSINLYTRSIIDARMPDFHGERYPFAKTKMLPKEFYLDEFYPECMYNNLSRLRDLPVYITENGCSCDNDDFRIIYITEYLSALNQAIKDGIDVRGFLYWSLLDNWEWGSFVPRFGLVDVDRENGFKRTIKPSAYFYKEIIEKNGFKQEILRKYLKEIPRVEY